MPKSPFPGMDPYLESHWGDVHACLIVYARDQVQKQLPSHLRVEEHVTFMMEEEENGKEERRGRYPDARVVEHPSAGAETPGATAISVLTEPLLIRLPLESQTQRSIQIIDTSSGDRVVTAIELLGPGNKMGQRGRSEYRRKQEELLQADASLVEIDLLRQGPNMMAAPAHLLPDAYRTPYRICVIRGYRPDVAEVYRMSLREPLPTIHLPLREGDPDAHLALQPLIDQCYENGRYDIDLDYSLDPEPALDKDDAAWADQLLREKGRRMSASA